MDCMQVMVERREFADELRELLGTLLSSRTGVSVLSTAQRQELRELVSVLSGIAFDSVGDASSVTGARLAVTLVVVDGKNVVPYLLVVWNGGQVQVVGPDGQAIDLGFSI